MSTPYDESLMWIVVVGFIVAFVLAFGIGANDVANSFGTSVGAGVLTIFQACVLATFFEIAGAVLIGYKVSDTMRKGILDVSLYDGHEKELMLGALSSLAGSGVWLIVATALRLPISGTHSIVGATVGFSLVCRGTDGVRWIALAHIAASWFASPVLSGIMSCFIFWLLKKSVLQSNKPFEQGLNILPVAYGLTVAINVMSIALDGPKLLMLDQMPWWGSLIAALLLGSLVAVIVYVFVVPWQRTRILLTPTSNSEKTSTQFGACDKKETTALSVIVESPCGSNRNGNANDAVPKLRGNSSESPLLMVAQAEAENAQADGIAGDEEQPEVSRLFAFLQVLTAAFGSFAHGGNDVSNAIGPLIALWAVYAEGSARQEAETPILILLYGGLGISTGLWVWGRRVIQTLGQDLARITPITGFTIEVGAAVTVLLASKAGLPVSTTHCKVGSVVCVGWVSRGGEGVSWKLFRNIAFAWLITVPMAGCLSAGCMAIFRKVQDYKLPHKLDILNGFRVVRDTNYGIGKRPTDAASAAYAEAPDLAEYEPSLTYGRVPRNMYRRFMPRYALLAQKCLCFKAFFRQAVFDSLNEHYRIRHVNIIYYLEDDTLCVMEPVVENAGFRQGKLVRRERILKNAKGDYFDWKDLNIGIGVCTFWMALSKLLFLGNVLGIHGVVYHIVDCSPFTKEFLTSQGVDVGVVESPPVDPYMEQRNVKYRTPMRVTRVADDSRRRFLEYDRMVLSFDATWNDDRYQMMYFLADDTMAIREIHEPNDGKDPVAMLLKRTRVPKDWKSLPSWHPSIYLEYEDSEIVGYYTPRDFRLGETIAVFGRRFLLHDCDSFTRKYYSDMLGIQQPSAIPFPARISDKLAAKYETPPHIGFGSPEDTYASCLSFLLRPPKKNVIRQLANFPKKLRYSARMDAVHPEDEDRDFVLEYSLSDGTVQVSEIEKCNSGRREGCFLSWRVIPKTAARKDDPVYYTPEDFFVGARINIFNHRFIITGADLFVYRYVEANRDKLPQKVRENLRNYFLQQGMLRDDVDVETRKIQEAEDKRDLLAINVIAKSSEDNNFDASKCTDDTAAVKNPIN